MYGVNQCSVIGSLLFTIDPIYFFLECENDDVNSYADDTTHYSWTDDIFCNYRTSKHCQQNFQVV